MRDPFLTLSGSRQTTIVHQKILMQKRVVFKNPILPYLLVAPQIIITLVFFIWPACMALYQSVLQRSEERR